MNYREEKIANQIWPQYSSETMEKRRKDALEFLGDRYLLSKPINVRPEAQRNG